MIRALIHWYQNRFINRAFAQLEAHTRASNGA
jgi:hypothetical protein